MDVGRLKIGIIADSINYHWAIPLIFQVINSSRLKYQGYDQKNI